MRHQFLTVLLQVLIVKSHDLLQEEIGITIYNMASVDFDSFYACFLPQFLQNCEMLNDTQKATLGTNFKLDRVSHRNFNHLYLLVFYIHAADAGSLLFGL
jgi:hypothetical protein